MNQEIERKIKENKEKIEEIKRRHSNKKLVWGILLTTLSGLFFALMVYVSSKSLDPFSRAILVFFLFVLACAPLPPGILLLILGIKSIRRMDEEIERLEKENRNLKKQL
ncbi:MAG: hypothetical protein K5892_07680 [Acholeplasmatales bacterium]|nr:hypothetical protein [Acholeplasmatales bacterium]